MIKKLSIFAVGLAIALPAAFASTTDEISLTESGFATMTASSGTGLVSFNNIAYGDFVANTVTGTGSPIFNEPDLNLQTVNVSAMNLSSSKTLTIELTETGLTGLSNPFLFSNAFTGILNGVTSEKLTTYIDPSNTAFGTAHMLATTTFTAQGSNANNQLVSGPTTSPFSETEIIVATFGATSGKPDSLDSSILIQSAVPEPASLALIGTGLLGLAFVRRRAARKS
ncbi:MAG: PEP-CTERM sorting domain-containing protein [Bryobacteraceae bacterium]